MVSWSSGKDSAYALAELLRIGDVEVVGLLTTVTQAFGRVSIHGVREELLQRQAAELRLPVHVVPIPYPCSNEEYDRRMRRATEKLRADGVEQIAFGDLFLAEVRAYRESRMREAGLTPIFPLWGRPTGSLARQIIADGWRARLVCVDPRHLLESFAGRDFDEELLRDLPSGVDPCGERGEFHTFVYGGPLFQSPIALEPGPVVSRDGFVFADFRERSSTPDPTGELSAI
ncbi:MAG: adenine nucleotide alpha hydrolase [Thermoplasmata archaeon]|nr:adenine nucleotide alpha hydrolase [Thermoplasmata archaeon]